MIGRGKRLAGMLGLLAIALAMVLNAAPAMAHSSMPSEKGGVKTEQTAVENIGTVEVFVPCALGGVGEIVQLSGNQVYRQKATTYPSGAFKIDLRVKYDGVVGVGQTSGEPYKVTSKTKILQSGVVPFPYTFTYKAKLKLKGAWSKTKFRTYESSETVVDANGISTTTSIGPLIDCRSKSQPEYEDD